MKEFNGRSNIKIYNADCMEYLKDMKDNEFGLAIVDPPYGINIDKKASKNSNVKFKKSATKCKDYGIKDWDSEIPKDKYFNELKRISKNQIIWGANYFGLKGGYIYWDKCVTMPTYSDGELAYCSKINGIKSISMAWHGMIQHNMKDKEIRIHPTQKPVQLYKWLLQNYAKENDKIIDTHFGSGSLGIACWDLKYDLTAFEIDKGYFDDSFKRIENHTIQAQIDDNIKEIIDTQQQMF